MTPDDLDTKSLEELRTIFAVEVCGWHAGSSSAGEYAQYWYDAEGRVVALSTFNLPRFSTSSDALLPWLEKEGSFNIDRNTLADDDQLYRVSLRKKPAGDALAPTFPHAAVKALIRAERAKKQSRADATDSP